MMSQTLSSWAQKDLYSLCKQIFSQMTMGIESKDFIFGLIPQRISISMESYGTIAKQCKLIQYEGFHQFLFFLLILSGLHISVFFVIYVIISCYTTISICERIVLGNLILARYFNWVFRFFVDNIPIRVFKNNTRLGARYPSQEMSVEGSIWNGESWASSGKKIEWSQAPFQAHYQEFGIYGCPFGANCSSESQLYWWIQRSSMN